jgi:drug/metabolite transporter (DMT)-like permease
VTSIVLLAILVAQTCGGLSSILTKLALEGLEPWTMVFFRQLIGVGLLFAMSRARSAPTRRAPFTRRDVLLLFTASWAGFALPQILLAWGIERSTGTMGSLLTPLEPIGIVLGGVWLLGDRLTPARVAALALGTVGAIAVLGQGHLDPTVSDPLGDGAIALGHLSWAIYTVASKPLLERHDPMRVSLLVVGLSLVPVGLLAWPEPFDFERAKASFGWLVALAVVGSALGTWTWNFALHHTTASTMAAFVFLQPVVGLAAGALALGEPVGPLAVAGALLVALAVALEAQAARAANRAAQSAATGGEALS